jgi:GrpB-like predicted nucleotidyltransferase (UPF0157 family)
LLDAGAKFRLRIARAFEDARAAIMDACGGCVLDMHHVGSTAIPGAAAKPMIDMMPLLRRHQVGLACVRPMEALGYKFRGDGGLSGRHYFIKGQPRTHHVHMYASDHPEVGRHARFRDYLRPHPREACAYEVLKRELAALFGGDTGAYSPKGIVRHQNDRRLRQLADDLSREGSSTGRIISHWPLRARPLCVGRPAAQRSIGRGSEP